MQSKLLIPFLSLVLFFCACKKKNDTAEETPDPEPAPQELYACNTLPPEPKPFGWQDSTVSVDKNIIAFIYNPVNSEEIIYMVEGDISGYNKIFTFNVVSGNKIFLGNCGPFLPSVNTLGWVVYSTYDNNLYKVKTNGDSLKQLTTNFLNQNPVWDHTGRKIFYFQQATLNVSSQMMRMGVIGPATIDQIESDCPNHASLNKSNQIVYLHTTAVSATMVKRNLDTGAELELLTGPFNPKTGLNHFNHICVDREDNNVYWSNTDGIFRMNFVTKRLDTIVKNCPSRVYDRPWISFHPNELTAGVVLKKPLSSFILFRDYKSVQLDLISGVQKEIRILP